VGSIPQHRGGEVKVRFYVDVPGYRSAGFSLYASTNPGSTVCEGWTRVAFDVDMPPEVWKAHDVVAPAATAMIVEAGAAQR